MMVSLHRGWTGWWGRGRCIEWRKLAFLTHWHVCFTLKPTAMHTDTVSLKFFLPPIIIIIFSKILWSWVSTHFGNKVLTHKTNDLVKIYKCSTLCQYMLIKMSWVFGVGIDPPDVLPLVCPPPFIYCTRMKISEFLPSKQISDLYRILSTWL